ncbi:MAG: hypothetical protein KIT54_07515 [Phycisphaeraceae bacterium]|nr:hypothetical protein [Phycisphaeraceae bacterium]
MGDPHTRVRFGDYAITRELPESPIARRLLAMEPEGRQAKVLHLFPIRPDDAQVAVLRRAIDNLRTIDNRHVLPVERLILGIVHQPCAVTPYTGHQDGLIDLGGLLAEKGGQMEPGETDRLLRQLFDGLGAAHARLIHHGSLRPRDILVDRRGSATIEMLGVARSLEGLRGFSTEVQRDEIRTVVELGFRCLTGHDAATVGLPASKLVRRLEPAWDTFFAHGLDPVEGFDTAAQAIAALPSADFDRLVETPRPTRAGLLTGFRRTGADRS